MKVIGVFGRKGGSGKSLISHFISHGMSMIKYDAVMFQTDVRDTPPIEMHPARPYYVSSISQTGNPADEFVTIYRKSERLERPILTIDGGANRRNVDLQFSMLCNIVLIPTGFSPEDIEVAESDREEILGHLEDQGKKTPVYLVMNRWPGEYRRLTALKQKKWIKDFLRRADRYRHVLPYFVPDMPSLIEMANANDPRYTALIDGRARSFASLVEAKIDDLSEDDEGKVAPYRDDMSFYGKKVA